MAKPSKQTSDEVDMDAVAVALAELAVRYPFRWFAQSKVGKMLGFGDNVMTELGGMGAPIVAKKCNPHLMHAWLTQNVEKIGKIRGDSE